MKKHLVTIFMGAAILFNACHGIKKAPNGTNQSTMETANSITGKKWQLVELAGQPVAAAINGKMPFIQLFDEENRFSASAGCNGLGGGFTLKKNKLKFTQGISTMMFCENMDVETEFKKMLEQVDNYTVNGDTLSLNKARMAPLARFRAIEENEAATLNGNWELDYISGTRIAFAGLFPDKKPTLTFNLPDTKATGNGSCNNFNVTFTIDGNNIKFNDPAATRMACPGDGEASFFNILKKVTKYSVNDNTLNFIMDDIAVMRFQKK